MKWGSDNIGKIQWSSSVIGKVYYGSNLVYTSSQPQPVEPTPNHACLTFRSSSSNTISITCAGTEAPTLYYSTDGTTWALWDYAAVSFSAGHPVFIYGDNTSGLSTSADNYVRIIIGGDGDVACSGNIMVLIDGAGTTTTIPHTYCFYRLFYGQSKLVTPPDMPATTLKGYCYNSAFQNTGITSVPALPATTLLTNCYNQMFRGCTNITEAPYLPALSLVTRCYYYMFYGCSKLKYVKAMFTTTPSTSYTSNWLNGAGSGGTFVKNVNATWTTTGVSAVPTSWTIETASPD